MRVACAGECMVELRERPDGSLGRAWGGDTLNTAVYLARLGVPVDYVTALGDDPWSDEMVAGWQAEGVGTHHVHRLPGQLPGLYIIQTDGAGERRFFYWRDSAAARRMFDHVDLAALSAYDTIYLSGITLSILPPDARELLFQTLATARVRGGRVVFDTNFRPRGWPDRTTAQAAFERAFALAGLVLASVEDLAMLFGPEGENRLRDATTDAELVLKLAEPVVRIRTEGRERTVEAEPVTGVVDTTAAGDSFAAAYLAARLAGEDPVAAARAGHRLAGLVVCHPGAIIPLAAMATLGGRRSTA
jgi:2-dehydro-3-deoxygluconokinase